MEALFLRIHPGPGFSAATLASLIPLPGQVQWAQAEWAAGETSHPPALTRSPSPGQKPDGT